MAFEFLSSLFNKKNRTRALLGLTLATGIGGLVWECSPKAFKPYAEWSQLDMDSEIESERSNIKDVLADNSGEISGTSWTDWEAVDVTSGETNWGMGTGSGSSDSGDFEEYGTSDDTGGLIDENDEIFFEEPCDEIEVKNFLRKEAENRVKGINMKMTKGERAKFLEDLVEMDCEEYRKGLIEITSFGGHERHLYTITDDTIGGGEISKKIELIKPY